MEWKQNHKNNITRSFIVSFSDRHTQTHTRARTTKLNFCASTSEQIVCRLCACISINHLFQLAHYYCLLARLDVIQLEYSLCLLCLFFYFSCWFFFSLALFFCLAMALPYSWLAVFFPFWLAFDFYCQHVTIFIIALHSWRPALDVATTWIASGKNQSQVNKKLQTNHSTSFGCMCVE